jgi:hypothetical protein
MEKKKKNKSTAAKKPKKDPVPKKINNAKPENYFMLVTGVPLKNIKELASACETMNDWVFNHHANEGRNDFTSWTEYVLKETELASEMKLARDARHLEIIILRYLVNKYL